MFDPILIITSFLLIITSFTSILYYHKLRKISEEYEKARNVIEDIVISFDRQLKRDENKIDGVMQKTEALLVRTEKALRGLETQEKQIGEIKAETRSFLEGQSNISNEIIMLKKQLENIKTVQDSLTQKIASIEKIRKIPLPREAEIEAIIPLHKEKVLAPLTETELAVLQMLVNKGEKTAPEIKNEIGLTREHTARLMKKLYEEGYVERSAHKIPYTYRVKEELAKLLKKAEAKV